MQQETMNNGFENNNYTIQNNELLDLSLQNEWESYRRLIEWDMTEIWDCDNRLMMTSGMKTQMCY